MQLGPREILDRTRLWDQGLRVETFTGAALFDRFSAEPSRWGSVLRQRDPGLLRALPPGPYAKQLAKSAEREHAAARLFAELRRYHEERLPRLRVAGTGQGPAFRPERILTTEPLLAAPVFEGLLFALEARFLPSHYALEASGGEITLRCFDRALRTKGPTAKGSWGLSMGESTT